MDAVVVSLARAGAGDSRALEARALGLHRKGAHLTVSALSWFASDLGVRLWLLRARRGIEEADLLGDQVVALPGAALLV